MGLREEKEGGRRNLSDFTKLPIWAPLATLPLLPLRFLVPRPSDRIMGERGIIGTISAI